jgi:hypothetical protein
MLCVAVLGMLPQEAARFLIVVRAEKIPLPQLLALESQQITRHSNRCFVSDQIPICRAYINTKATPKSALPFLKSTLSCIRVVPFRAKKC